MKSITSTCRAVSLVLLVGALGCQTARQAQLGPAEKRATEDHSDDRGFDPLGLPSDREIVPSEYKNSAEIRGKALLRETDEETEDSAAAIPVDVPSSVDTLNSRAFRVQFYTGKLFGEARRELRIAEEIFDRPVFFDYEVPYYKVRVGTFAERQEAEEYQMRVKAAGYSSAWVVSVKVGVKQTAPLYQTEFDYYEEPVDTGISPPTEEDNE
jgi:hypothetical protein